VTTRWLGDTSSASFSAQSSHYEEYPIFKVFDREYCLNHHLPTGAIPTRYNSKTTVLGTTLNTCIETLLKEVAQKKKHYTHFDILTKKNFNRSKRCGLMILKFKNYPFVIKLFIETPETFLNSRCKGLDNIWFFPMSGGVNRHITGLTRLKNLETIRNHIANDPRWNRIMDTPRKWFWLPAKPTWLEIEGHNIGTQETIRTAIPGTYAVIADAIDAEQKLSVFHSYTYSTITMDFCNSIHIALDPHLDNFMIEKNSGKMVIIDTEHFPTVVGFKDEYPQTFNSYIDWYSHLAKKFMSSCFFRTKRARKLAQLTPHLRTCDAASNAIK
jgi:hypothetical protein